MARISLVDIPNAPQGLADPAMARVPEFGFDGRGAANQLMQSPIEQGSFDGPAKGMQAIGQGLMDVAQGAERASSVFTQLAVKRLEAKNEADVAKASTMINQRVGEFQAASLSLPPEEVESHWSKQVLPQLQKDIAGIGMSKSAYAHVMNTWGPEEAKIRTNILYDVTKRQLQRDSDAIGENFDMLANTDQLDRAEQVGRSAVEKGLWSEGRLYQRMEKAKMASTERSINGAMANDARQTVTKLKEAYDKGESDWFPYLNKHPELRAAYLEQAEKQLNGWVTLAYNKIVLGVQSGGIKTKEQVDAADSFRAFSPEQKETAYKFLAERAAYDAQKLSGTRTAVVLYRPRGSGVMEKFRETAELIATTVPKAMQPVLMGELINSHLRGSEGKPAGMSQVVRGAVYAWVDNLVKLKFIDADRAIELKDGFDSHIGEVPKPSQMHGRQWLDEQTMGDRHEAGVRAFGKPPAEPKPMRPILPGPMPIHPVEFGPPKEVTPEEIDKAKEKRKSRSAASEGFTPALATQFGYQDREDNGMGAWGHKTNDRDVMGASLPIALLRERFGDDDLAKGAIVEVRNPANGKTIRVPIIDKGPAGWVVKRQGMTIDLTHAANRELGTNGKSPVEFRIL